MVRHKRFNHPIIHKDCHSPAEPAQLHTRTHTHTTHAYTQRIKRDKISLFLCHSHFTFPLVPHRPSITPRLTPPSLSLSLPPSFTLALCEGHAIDFPLSIHFSVLVLKRGKQTKAIPYPHPRTQPPLPRLTAHRSHPSKSRAGLTFLQCGSRYAS